MMPPPPRPKPPTPLKPGEKPAEEPKKLKPIATLSPELLAGGSVNIKELLKKIEERVKQDHSKDKRFPRPHNLGQIGGLTAMPAPPVPPEEAGYVDGEELDETGKKRLGAVKGRDERHKKRSARAKSREELGVGDLRRINLDDDDAPSPQRLHRHRQPKPQGTQPRKGNIVIEPPITVRSLSEAMGIRVPDLLRKLMDRKMMVTINAQITEELAEELAIECGVELEIKRPQTVEETIIADASAPDRPEDLQPRAPIVTIMGHVDHGKTSLLDRIRESNVVATEAGGITQHLRAWRVEHGGRPITFLDTPGHEAFTAMRARGANVTDIVVLVVAADDGIMPQTDEAISHAKAAGVPIIIAINKVDLPNANLNKTRQQLYAKELIPDDMGGDTPFVETVSVAGKARGIDTLLDTISLVAELEELKANPNKPASGTCLEARIDGDQGVSATFLVQDGTLRKGDVLLCGTSYGRVRAMFDDLGRPLEEAGPSVPVRVMGLDEAPNASDKFHVVADVSQAREVAEQRRIQQRAATSAKLSTFRLEDLGKSKVHEVKVIVKADVRGSIEAILKELLKLDHDEVKIKVLHVGVGAITEGDVQLALASPEDSIILGFNVVPDDRAQRLADEKGVQIRQYDIIYKLSDDLKAALEGKLKPREEVVHLGRAVVRKAFKISRVGTVAGCYVTQGTIERSARIRLIRDGVVIYPPAERTATLESLKRVKDDVREVREGFECGIKIAGYDDVKEGDVIEAFKVEQVQRTL
jgi:translation initiation factor IF-2